MRVLSWITYTRRPLSVDELHHGLAVEYGDNEVQEKEFDPENLLSPKSLIDVCAGLVVIESRSQIIRLVHYTTQEYFDKECSRLFEDAEIDIRQLVLPASLTTSLPNFLVKDWFQRHSVHILSWAMQRSIGSSTSHVLNQLSRSGQELWPMLTNRKEFCSLRWYYASSCSDLVAIPA